MSVLFLLISFRFKSQNNFETDNGYFHGYTAPLSILTHAPLTLSLPSALCTYLFVAHTLGAPAEQALGAAVLAAGVTAGVGLFCVGLVSDVADTLYVCYCIDKEAGERRREEAFAVVSVLYSVDSVVELRVSFEC